LFRFFRHGTAPGGKMACLEDCCPRNRISFRTANPLLFYPFSGNRQGLVLAGLEKPKHLLQRDAQTFQQFFPRPLLTVDAGNLLDPADPPITRLFRDDGIIPGHDLGFFLHVSIDWRYELMFIFNGFFLCFNLTSSASSGGREITAAFYRLLSIRKQSQLIFLPVCCISVCNFSECSQKQICAPRQFFLEQSNCLNHYIG
jgi:hypothetical protein